MRVTVIFTVLNEAHAIHALLDSLAAQTQPPDEVVVCDGGSRDDTVRLLREEARLKLQVIEAPGANISRGRNVAIAAASHDIIACTDAGVRLHPHWLAEITRPFADSDTGYPVVKPTTQKVNWVAGFFCPEPRTQSVFHTAMSATVLPALRDIHPSAFLPSSRSVAFSKSAWVAIGGYPEWLDYCEDLVFDFALRARYGPCSFAPSALVYFQPRSSLRSFFKQYYLYARGDGKANLWIRRHAVRYATYLLALPLLLSGLMAPSASGLPILAGLLLILGCAVAMRTPYRRLAESWHALPAMQKLQAAFLVPVIRITGDVAKMIGYPAGVAWRLRRQRRRRQAGHADGGF